MANTHSDFNMDGQAAKSIAVGRTGTTSANGSNLTIQAGGAAGNDTATNKTGGALILSGGTSTGNVGSQIEFYGASGGTPGTGDNLPIRKMMMTVGAKGRLIVGTSFNDEVDGITLSGNSARTLQTGRQISGNGQAGSSLTIKSGGAAANSTDKAAGDLVLTTGISTGSGSSQMLFQTASAGSPGTTDNTPTTKMTLAADGSLSVSGAISASNLSGSNTGDSAGHSGLATTTDLSTHTSNTTDAHNLVTRLAAKSDTSHTHSTYIIKAGDTGIGDLGLEGEAARSLTVARRASGDVAGNNLTIQAGGATDGGVATNRASGALILSTGVGTGSAVSNGFIFKHAIPGSTGTSNQTVANMAIMWRQSSTQYNFVLNSTTTGHLGNGISINGNAAGAVGLVRHTTDNTAGNNLTVNAGGTKGSNASTDKAGGTLILAPGVSTGTGTAQVKVQTMTKALSTGTGDNTATDRMIFTSPLSLSDNVAATLVSATLASGSCVGIVIDYAVECTDGTDYQVETGQVSFAAVNKGGSYTVGTPSKVGNVQALSSAATLTVTFSQTSANPSLIQVTADTSLASPSTGYPRITFAVKNLTQQAVTVS